MSEQKKYILVAEDDKFFANIYRTKLTKEGYEVAIVGDGVQTLKALRQRKPDLLLLDLIMPVKDGFETLKELKANPELRSIKILVLSSLGQEEDARRAREMGADEYVVKTSVTIDEMVDKIASYVGRP